MKKNLLYRLCLLTMALALSSCRQDYFPEKENTYNNSSAFHLTSKRISLNEAKHKDKLVTEIKKAEVEIETKGKADVKGKVINYGNGVSIDTDNVTYIENGPNYHTYTFNIIREGAPANAPLENLVLTPLSDGSYKELLVTYNLTAFEKEQLAEGLPVETNGKTEVMELAKGTYNGSGQLARFRCFDTVQTYWAPCSGSQHHDGSNYESCPIYNGQEAGTPPIAYTLITTTCIDIKDDVITPGDPGGSSGGGGGGGTCTDCPEIIPPKDPCNGNGVFTGPQDPTISPGNGGCGGVVTTPTLTLKNDPCAKIKAKFADQRFKDKVAELDNDSIFTKKKEKGYAAAYGPQTNYESLKNITKDKLKMPPGNKYFGYMHSHLDKDGVVKIFSSADVFTFLLSCVRNAKEKGTLGDAYAMVITSQGNYMLKYSGSGGYTLAGQSDKWKKAYKDIFEELLRIDALTQPNVEKAFTKFLKETVNINGVEVYKVDKTTGKANKLEYNGENNPVKSTPCPN